MIKLCPENKVMHLWGFVAQMAFRSAFPFPQTDLPYGHGDGYAKCGVAVEYRDSDLDFRDLPVEVPRHEALPHQFHTMHLALDAAPAMVFAPPSPDSATEVSRRVDRFVPSDGPGAGGLPRFSILPRRYDGVGMAVGNRFVAFARVVGPIGGYGVDVLFGRDLVQQFGQHWRVTDMASGDFHGSDFQRFCVDPYVYLAPNAPLRATVLACVPLALTFGLDACTIDQKVQWPGSSAIREADIQALLATA